MKKQHIQQEVLISIRTTLAKKALLKTSHSGEDAAPIEKFEEACWNGLLNEMFSELLPYNQSELAKIFIWGIRAGKSYLLVDLADGPGFIESALSVDPHLFLPKVNLS